MKSFFTLLALLSIATTQAEPPQQSIQAIEKNQIMVDENVILISDSDEMEKEITANGEDILVTGNNNMITITGKVNKIVITGKANDINLDEVQEIQIIGNYNFVGWKTAGEQAQPKTSDKGSYNNIGKRSSAAQKHD